MLQVVSIVVLWIWTSSLTALSLYNIQITCMHNKDWDCTAQYKRCIHRILSVEIENSFCPQTKFQ